jgi:NNP family nitrate/nitrite transporter-like MFS transporter
MARKSFLKSGHTPTLIAAFLYFDLAFMVWVMLGPLGVQIAKDLNLDHVQKGMMVATPVLAGAAFRIVLGILVDHLNYNRHQDCLWHHAQKNPPLIHTVAWS